MKSRKRREARFGIAAGSRERAIRGEMKSFLLALSSYPDRFARDPYISFEQHLFSIVAAHRSAASDAGQHD
jgi:hypothetical protein